MSSTRLRLVLGALFLPLASVSFLAYAEQPTGAPSTVVAKQGDAIVTIADVDTFAQRIPENERKGFFDSPKRLESMLYNLLLQKQLAAEARKLGMDKDPVVQAQIEAAAEETLSRVRMQRFRADLKVPDFATLAKEDYLVNKAKYAVKGTLDVKHVLVSTTSRSEEEARKIADMVEKEARAHPDQFDALVEKYSEDPSKDSNHGLMTDAGSEKYVQAFADAAKALTKPDEISPVIKSPYGFHVLKLIERTPDRPRSLAEVQPEIVARLRNDYVEKAAKTHADELRNLPVDANADLVASLRTRYADTAASPAPTTDAK